MQNLEFSKKKKRTNPCAGGEDKVPIQDHQIPTEINVCFPGGVLCSPPCPLEGAAPCRRGGESVGREQNGLMDLWSISALCSRFPHHNHPPDKGIPRRALASVRQVDSTCSLLSRQVPSAVGTDTPALLASLPTSTHPKALPSPQVLPSINPYPDSALSTHPKDPISAAALRTAGEVSALSSERQRGTLLLCQCNTSWGHCLPVCAPEWWLSDTTSLWGQENMGWWGNLEEHILLTSHCPTRGEINPQPTCQRQCCGPPMFCP